MERITYQDIPAGMFEKLRDIEDYLHVSPISMQMLELIRLRVAQLNNCAYCVDMHHKELQHTGETDLRLSSLCVWSETPYFSEKEMAVLKLAEALSTRSNSEVSDELFEQLLTHFSKPEISYLTLAIAQINTWANLMKTFRFTPGKYKVQT